MTEQIWTGVGLLGQALFASRFLVQWIASERRRRSVVPPAFWYLSLAGGLLTLTYAIYLLNPVFILGYAPGLLIYARNVWLIHREPGRLPDAPG